jgi:itaconate CoA-transferase
LEPNPATDRDRLPLAGIRVVALEQAVAGPLCSRHLADLGADVVKIERPDGGDFARRYDTAVQGLAAHWVWLNRGKRSVALDVKQPDDRAVLDALLARADVFLHNLGPGAVDRLGLGWAALHERWPRLTSCAISGYGMDGPYRDRKAFDLLLQGESAVIAVTGSPEQPAKVGISIGDISAAMYALSSILAALYERQRTGKGRMIDVAMLDCLAEWMAPPIYYQLYDGVQPERAGVRHTTIVPYGPYRTGDGTSVNLAVQNEGQWARLCRDVLNRPEWVDHPRYRSNVLRTQNRAELEPLIEEALQAHTRATAQEALERADVPYGALNDVADLVAHPQLTARGRWYDVASEAGSVRALAHPLNIVGMPQRMDPVPALGEHTEAIKRELGLA